MTTNFKQTSTATVIDGGFTYYPYLWSTNANWLGGVPGNGATVTFDIIGGPNPSSYDDIANLSLNSLNLVSGDIGVGGSLEIGSVSFGNTDASVYSDTDLGSPSATLVVDGFSGVNYGRVGAFGPGALTEIRSPTDPGEIYQVDEGGELVLDPTPLSNAGTTQAGFYYQNSGSPSGTFAFRDPGATIALPLSRAAVGDSIALPGSDVSSVTYGTSSITVVTNLGTTVFSNADYLAGSVPTGFTATPDPVSGLERITFTNQQSVTFEQTTTSTLVVDGFTYTPYLWSTNANWLGGVPPGDGDAVTVNAVGGPNPSGYDDISGLFLDSLNLVSGEIGVGGSLEIGSVSFGNTDASVYSDTDLGSPAATLIVDGFSGTSLGRIGAFGPNALTEIRSPTDPGEIYQVDEGGELVLDPTPLNNPGTGQAGFYYQNSGSPSGTFAFRNPGATVALPLSRAAIGDSIALPGSDVSSVTYGTSSIIVVTNLGTTVFSDADYLAGSVPTGFLATPDPISGLERITFTNQQSYTFEQTTTSTVIVSGFAYTPYLWSTPANWLGGVPPSDGAAVTVNVIGGPNPSGYDDIANLFLDSLNLVSGEIGVGGSLEIGSVRFGNTDASVYSDTDLGSPAASLMVDGFSGGTLGRVGAFGPGALTEIRSPTDPGEIYQVDEGGELVLDPTPLSNAGATQAGFYYQNSGSPSGTFAFRNPGATIALPLSRAAVGDSIALPGSDVSSVTYGTSSITVVTNLGTTVFSNADYLAGSVPTGFTATPDPISGLERITFTNQQSVTFEQTTTSTVIVDGFAYTPYLWSTPANWLGGVVPGDGDAVTVNAVGGPNPSGYDDISGLFLDSLNLVSGEIGVGGSLEIGSVSFGNTDASVYSDTDLGSPAATLVVDGFSGASLGRIGAFGPDALTEIRSPADPGEIYQVDEGGELVLDPTPLNNPGTGQAGFYYQNSGSPSGTFAFRNPGATIALPLSRAAIGDSIALPGSDVSSVTYGTSSITVVTNLGTTVFSDVDYLSNNLLTGFLAAADPVAGLERITFTGPDTTFEQTSTTTVINNGFTYTPYLWSTPANWTAGVPQNGQAIGFDIVGGPNPSGYDDIANLFLNNVDLVSGEIGVGGSLEIVSISFGNTDAAVYSDTDLGSQAATLVVDGFSGASLGRIGAFGQNALTEIRSPTDPGEIYQVDENGELVLDPTPLSNPGATQAGFYYQNSGSPSGTFAFRNPGGTIALPLSRAAIGDSIALPGSDVSSVTYGASSITVVTNLGTTVFSNVDYLAGAVPTGFLTAPDPISGLERITFTNLQSTSFQRVTSGFAGQFLWSNSNNWTTNVVPGDGAAVTFGPNSPNNPAGYDDIGNLFLDSLNLQQGDLGVAGTLTIATLAITSGALIETDTLLNHGTASVVIDGLSGASGFIEAAGTNAVTTVQAATDPGEVYAVTNNGTVVLATALNAASQVELGLNTADTGTVAFRNQGATIVAQLENVGIGDAIELAGSFVSSVTYSGTTMRVVTSAGATLFSNVQYRSPAPTGFTAAADPATGLEKITFTTLQTTAFQQSVLGSVGGNPEYLWSNASNWTTGVVPGNGSTVSFNINPTTNPGGYDDIGSLFLDTLNLQSGYLAVGGALTIGRLAFSEAGKRGIAADTLLNGGTASVVIDGFGSSGGTIAAEGANAVTTVQAPTDPGAIYQAADGGMVVVSSALRPTSVLRLNFGDGPSDIGTIALINPGATIAAALQNVGVGDAIELPGSSASSVSFGANDLVAVTNLGTTTFSNVTYLTGSTPTGFTASADPTTGLEKLTFNSLCFCRDTLIATPSGQVKVQELAVGDLVMTLRGEARPIVWIGTGAVLAIRGRRNAATPVIVRKGALGDNVPSHDLRVTKGHALYLDDVLIPVEFLVNHRSIEWDDRAQEVALYHIELETHDVLLANGAPAESYRDDGNRWLFRNANSGWGQPAKAPCAPVQTGGSVVDAVWRRLLNRAGPRPGQPLTDDPDLHLLVDGNRVDAASRDGSFHVFRLPGKPTNVRIVSRSGAPQEHGLARDARCLGVALRQIMATQAVRIRLVGAEDALLADGFHGFEPELGLRWTDGDAAVPALLFDGFTGPLELTLRVTGTTSYSAVTH